MKVFVANPRFDIFLDFLTDELRSFIKWFDDDVILVSYPENSLIRKCAFRIGVQLELRRIDHIAKMCWPEHYRNEYQIRELLWHVDICVLLGRKDSFIIKQFKQVAKEMRIPVVILDPKKSGLSDFLLSYELDIAEDKDGEVNGNEKPIS